MACSVQKGSTGQKQSETAGLQGRKRTMGGSRGGGRLAGVRGQAKQREVVGLPVCLNGLES